MKSKLFNFVMTASICGLIWSCTKTESQHDTTIVLDKNLIKSPIKYAELMKKRDNGSGSFVIEKIERNGNTLNILVKGGCDAGDFTIVWDGSVQFSFPGQINLLLHNHSERFCEPETPISLSIDLQKIIEKDDPNDFIFIIANGSSAETISLLPNDSIISR